MEITVAFSELRQSYKSIIGIVASKNGFDSNELSVSDAVNFDLGIDGDDWVDTQDELEKMENVSFEGLQFYKYFLDESQISDPLGVLLWLVQMAWYLLTFAWLKVKFCDFYDDMLPEREKLTIGDIIASKYAGKFIQREKVKFVFAPKCI